MDGNNANWYGKIPRINNITLTEQGLKYLHNQCLIGELLDNGILFYLIIFVFIEIGEDFDVRIV